MGELLELSDEILDLIKENQIGDSGKVLQIGANVDHASDSMLYTCGIYLVPTDVLVGEVPSLDKFEKELKVVPEGAMLDMHSILHHKQAVISSDFDKQVISDYLDMRDNYLNFMLQFAREHIKFAFDNKSAGDPRYFFAHEVFLGQRIISNDPRPKGYYTRQPLFVGSTGLKYQIGLSQKAREKIGIESR